MIKKFIFSYTILLIILTPLSASSRCAVCYTNGLSGASIAVIVIVSSFTVLFFANKFLRKFLDKDKN
jgi:hypothetical protein